MRTLRAGIIGGGFIGAQHVEAVRRLGYVEVAALAGSDLGAAAAGAATLHIPRAYGSYQELLADPAIDVVHNCTPNALHYPINRAALEAGKHVISEKPLAMTSEQTASLLAIARERRRLAAVNFNHRGYPMVQQARALIAAGHLGQVRLLHGTYLQDWLLYPDDWNWRLDPSVGGASRAVADIGSHWADLLQHVTGQRIRRVLADLHTVVPARRRPASARQTFGKAGAPELAEDVIITTEDYGAIIFETEQGARGVFAVSQVSAGRKNRLSFEVNGAQASLSWDSEAPEQLWVGYREQANQLRAKDPAQATPAVNTYMHLPAGHAEAWPDALKNVMAEIYRAVRDDRHRPAPTDLFAEFRDGHQAALLVDAVLASAQQGRWVEVPKA